MSNPSEMRGATPADAPSSAHSKKTIGELVAEVSQKFSALVRDEIKLAQVQLTENYAAALDEVLRLKPSSAKGRYLKKITVSTTTGPGIPVDTSLVRKLVEGGSTAE